MRNLKTFIEFLNEELWDYTPVPFKFIKKYKTDTKTLTYEYGFIIKDVKIDEKLIDVTYFCLLTKDKNHGIYELQYKPVDENITYETQTNYGNISTILSTVMEITKDFIKKTGEDTILKGSISEDEPIENINQRNRVYIAFLKKHLKSQFPNHNTDYYRDKNDIVVMVLDK